MIVENWLAFVNNMLPPRIRGNRFGSLISALASQASIASEQVKEIADEAMLKASITNQKIWLEHYLSSKLGETITIEEADGLPYDFTVFGVSLTNQNLARAIINKYKLAGRSYIFDNSTFTTTAAWSDAGCEVTELVIPSAMWSSAGCELKLEEIDYSIRASLSRVNGSYMTGTVTLKRSSDDAVIATEIVNPAMGPIFFTWAGLDNDDYYIVFDKIIVDSTTTTQHSYSFNGSTYVKGGTTNDIRALLTIKDVWLKVEI